MPAWDMQHMSVNVRSKPEPLCDSVIFLTVNGAVIMVNEP